VQLVTQELQGTHPTHTETVKDSTCLVASGVGGGLVVIWGEGVVLGGDGAQAGVGEVMEDTANGHLELGSLCLTDASLEIRVLLDYRGQYSQSIALTKMIMQVTGGLHQPQNIIFLDNLSESDLILAQFCQDSVRVHGCLKVSAILLRDLLDE